MSRRRAAATSRVSFNPSGETEGEQKEQRRSKAMSQLVFQGLTRCDEAAAQDERKAGPFKPGQIADACFELAPDGKFKGMKFRKSELMQALRVLAVPSNANVSGAPAEQRHIFAVASNTKSGQVRYSSYPIDPSALPASGRRGGRAALDAAYGPDANVVCGVKIPAQRVAWPRWPDQRAVYLQRAVTERKVDDDKEKEEERVSKLFGPVKLIR